MLYRGSTNGISSCSTKAWDPGTLLRYPSKYARPLEYLSLTPVPPTMPGSVASDKHLWQLPRLVVLFSLRSPLSSPSYRLLCSPSSGTLLPRQDAASTLRMRAWGLTSEVLAQSLSQPRCIDLERVQCLLCHGGQWDSSLVVLNPPSLVANPLELRFG